MSVDMEKSISHLIRSLADTFLWICAAVMTGQNSHPKHGLAGVLFHAAVIIGVIWVCFDIWRWFANRRAA